ncbi:hypothetical protein, partial [Lysinibacillus fusiformis]
SLTFLIVLVHWFDSSSSSFITSKIYFSTPYVDGVLYVEVDWNEGRRLLREKRESRDPGLSGAREAARPRPRKASARSGNQRLYFISL